MRNYLHRTLYYHPEQLMLGSHASNAYLCIVSLSTASTVLGSERDKAHTDIEFHTCCFAWQWENRGLLACIAGALHKGTMLAD